MQFRAGLKSGATRELTNDRKRIYNDGELPKHPNFPFHTECANITASSWRNVLQCITYTEHNTVLINYAPKRPH